MPDDFEKNATTALVSATASTAAAAAGTAAGGVLAATLAALFPGVLLGALVVGFDYRKHSVSAWWEAFTAPGDDEPGVTREEIAGHIDAHKDEPHVRETILRGVRALFDAVADAAVIPLGVLAREYRRAQRRPDAYFRNAVGVLTSVSDEELEDLRALTSWMLSCEAQTIAELHFSLVKGALSAHFRMRDAEGFPRAAMHGLQRELTNPQRLLALLTLHEFLQRTPVWGGEGWELNHDAMCRLAALLKS